jgi:hypothetical protein
MVSILRILFFFVISLLPENTPEQAVFLDDKCEEFSKQVCPAVLPGASHLGVSTNTQQ